MIYSSQFPRCDVGEVFTFFTETRDCMQVAVISVGDQHFPGFAGAIICPDPETLKTLVKKIVWLIARSSVT